MRTTWARLGMQLTVQYFTSQTLGEGFKLLVKCGSGAWAVRVHDGSLQHAGIPAYSE